MIYKMIRDVVRPFFYLFSGKTKIIGKENIEAISEGSAIICANHMSNWDPFIIGFVVKRQIFFMAKKALFTNKLLGKIMYAGGAIPVEKSGNDISSIKQALRILKSGEILGIFPEGKRYRDGYVHEFKDGLALIAHKMKVKVLPIGIKGRAGLFKRTVIEIGKPMVFDEFYDQKGSPEIYKQMNELLYKEISRLAFGKNE